MGRDKFRGRTYTEERLKKAVKNYNAKVKRLLKTSPELAPNKLSYATILRNIKTQSELRREIKEIEKFNKRGAEKATVKLDTGVKVSRWQYNRGKRKLKAVNAQRTQQRDTVYEKYTGYEYIAGKKVRQSVLPRVRHYMEENEPHDKGYVSGRKGVLGFNKAASNLENAMYHESLESKAELYRSNLIKAINKTYADGDKDKLNQLVNIIKNLSWEKIQDIYYKEGVEADVIDIKYHYYDPRDTNTKIDWALSVLSKL